MTKRTRKPPPPDLCRLLVVIRGESYSARALASPDGRAWRLRRADQPGDPIDVAESLDGPARCTCGDFEFRRAGIDPLGCKHVRALRALGLIG